MRVGLPHFDVVGAAQSITFRLADSLPKELLLRLERELELMPVSERDLERRKKIDQWLDAGMGCCALRHPVVAKVMQETLFKFHGERYELMAWCIMPNHVHVVIETKSSLSKIVQSWKSFTGRWVLAKAAELGLGVPRAGSASGRGNVSEVEKYFWMRDYWDRYIRDDKHLESVVDYIHYNPVKAGLCRNPQDWPWSGLYPENVLYMKRQSER